MKKNEESQKFVRHHQAYQHTRNWSPRRREEKGTERMFEEIMAENLLDLIKDVNGHIQKAQWTSSRTKSRRYTPRYIIIKLSKIKDKENHEISKREMTCQAQGIINKINSWFLIRNHRGQRVWDNIFKMLKAKKNPCQPRIIYPAKWSCRNERDILIASFFTIASMWKQPKCPSVD